ncbi:hypothetical protein B6D29_02880 [Microgenomates bacterium UTCPR1]|nr:MAG: hypothetical protein B6D29_02880 [Microgenomates bacterium UTCPR1]
MSSFFEVSHRSSRSKARLGEIRTDHGVIKTPSFVAVGTKGTIKTLTPELVREIKTQVAFVNTYHLVTHPGADIIEKVGGIHNYSKLNMPLMSDSGGFQVFSLAQSSRARQHNFSHTSFIQPGVKQSQRKADVRGEEEPLLVKITEDGVKFRSIYDGQLVEFTPEKSMEYQLKIGADINMAFDECTYYPATHEYAEKAMKRTHQWLKRCIQFGAQQRVFSSTSPPKGGSPKSLTQKQLSSLPFTNHQSLSANRYLYGVIQGAIFEDLRKKSAEFVVSQNTPGVAIGGVSVGETKKEMRDQVRWVADYLPKDRPVHLLGVGQIDDIVDLVKYGIDTFDCVEPTRLARMGVLYEVRKQNFLSQRGPFRHAQDKPYPESEKNLFSSPPYEIDITQSIYKNNLEPVDVNCDCYTCSNFAKSYLHHLFKQREILGYTLATIHNLWTMERLFEKIREMIGNNLI